MIYAGARMMADSAGVADAERSAGYEYIDALLKIRALNARATNEWTRYNNAGVSAGYEASERKQARCWDHAQRIAQARGWKITAPGLWWIIRDGKGNDITPRE
jgi:hypothetical protein